MYVVTKRGTKTKFNKKWEHVFQNHFKSAAKSLSDKLESSVNKQEELQRKLESTRKTAEKYRSCFFSSKYLPGNGLLWRNALKSFCALQWI
jgi:hypothetical protein